MSTLEYLKIILPPGTGVLVGIILVALIVSIVVGGIATRYLVQFWSSYFRKESVRVPFLPCAIVGFFFGWFTIPAAVVTWLLSFALPAGSTGSK